MNTKTQPRVIIIGAGFGGLFAARALAGKAADVLLIDRNNFHLFTPLLYQVATCALDPSEISQPVRGLFRRGSNVHFMMGEVEDIDTANRAVTVRTNGTTRREAYDYLIVAAGSNTNFFDNGAVAEHAFELKTLGDGVYLRNHMLRSFERAAWADDPAHREALTTLVVVGGGPTGLEMAGSLRELSRHVLQEEYGHLNGMRPRVILLEATDRVMAPYPPRLREAALRQLESLGVEVMLDSPVEDVASDHVRLRDGRIIPTHTVIWVAGVKGSPLAEMLDVPVTRNGRVIVTPTLEAPGLDGVYVVGDLAYQEDAKGEPYPMLAPVAMQQGRQAVKNILAQIAGQPQQPFHYKDRGIMATIGRSRAVSWLFYRVQLSGFVAWVVWLAMHLLWLMGFRNRLSVLLGWVWNYFTFERSVRIILQQRPLRTELSDEQTWEAEPEDDLASREKALV